MHILENEGAYLLVNDIQEAIDNKLPFKLTEVEEESKNLEAQYFHVNIPEEDEKEIYIESEKN